MATLTTRSHYLDLIGVAHSSTGWRAIGSPSTIRGLNAEYIILFIDTPETRAMINPMKLSGLQLIQRLEGAELITIWENPLGTEDPGYKQAFFGTDLDGNTVDTGTRRWLCPTG